MNREKGERHNQFLDKWLKSLDGYKQEARAMKEERIHEWMQKLPKIGTCSSHEPGGSQKFGKSVASAKKFQNSFK